MQSRVPPIRFEGPFLGLDTTRDPTEIGKGFARVARNGLVTRGSFRPRMPFRALFHPDDAPGPPTWRFDEFGGRVVSMRTFQNPAVESDAARILIKTITPVGGGFFSGQLWQKSLQLSVPGAAEQVATDLSGAPADFARFGDWVYVLDASDRILKVSLEGHPARYASLRSPRGGIQQGDEVRFLGAGSGSPGLSQAQQLAYAVTYFDSLTGVESNPAYSEVAFRGAAGDPIGPDCQGTYVPAGQVFDMALAPSLEPYVVPTHFRIYRRNLTLGQTGYRLVATVRFSDWLADDGVTQEISVASYDDGHDEANIVLSSDVAGPFAPARNGLLQRAAMGAAWKNRLWTVQTPDPTRMYFSAIGFPDHQDPDDYLDLSGDADDAINGLVAVGDQVYAGKEKNIWAIAGDVATPTNDTIATGAEPLEGTERVYRTQATVGPGGNSRGNHFVLAGEPGRIYFPNRSGFYDFDGNQERLLSDLIRDTWLAFAFLDQTTVGWFTFADDPVNQVLYIAESLFAAHDTDAVLAYHYGRDRGDRIGCFTTVDLLGASPVYDADEETRVISAVTALVSRSGVLSTAGQSALIIGTKSGHVALSDDADYPSGLVYVNGSGPSRAPLAAEWEWESGDIELSRGFGVHVYFSRAFFGGAYGLGEFAAPVDFTVTLDKGNGAKTASGTVDLSQGNRSSFSIPVRRSGERVRLNVKRGAGWRGGWNPDLAFAGWDLNAELVGQ